MRVIAGSAKRLLLKTIEGQDTRPTTDRIKETLFNMLQYDLADCRFLDLFAGSGAIGIEALSRGASFCVFVEQNPKVADCIRENLQITGLSDKALVMNCDVFTALQRLNEKEDRFDFIFLDPPYDQNFERRVLSDLIDTTLIDKQSTIVIEASIQTRFDDLDSMGFVLEKQKKYKTNQHVFVYRGE